MQTKLFKSVFVFVKAKALIMYYVIFHGLIDRILFCFECFSISNRKLLINSKLYIIILIRKYLKIFTFKIYSRFIYFYKWRRVPKITCRLVFKTRSLCYIYRYDLNELFFFSVKKILGRINLLVFTLWNFELFRINQTISFNECK